ncbi:MAG TPA: Ig-like domain-containing protein [Terracidiphilus sp.]
MRRLFCRGLRLELVAALGMALGVPALAQGQQAGSLKSTATTLSAGTRVEGGHTLAALTVSVMGEDGLPATGSVVIEEDGRQLAGVALSAEGRASLEISLPAGENNLTAVYGGDTAHQTSASKVAGVHAAAVSTPDFGISVSPASLSLTAGQSGSATVSVSPINASALTAPMFVTLSCSGYPDQSTCTFTPENVEILPNATTATLSSMVITTQAKSLVGQTHPAESNPVAWAILLPGIAGLGGLAFSVRRHRWLSRLSLLALLAFVSILGATACAPRYNYYNHGPPFNLPTPAGSYTLSITAQSSNGIAATTRSTPFALTVK